MAIVTAKEFAEDVWNMLCESVEEEMPEATVEEKEKAKAAILNALSGQMFTAKMG